MKKIFFALFLSLLLPTTLLADGDKNEKAQIEVDYQATMKFIGQDLLANEQNLTSEERELLHFLYAYMPLADITNYPSSFHRANLNVTLKARNEMAWGKSVPELLFRHFVLPVRVNNEDLDAFRTTYYEELKQRVKGLSMKDAILEVNHWCHEHVTYQPSDARTLSPIHCMANAFGRCGEESTYTVAALRAIGIPARQVYTPRWAHTDDNHAWVEAWADGTWYFLGACEPEAVLNLGWFNEPASRAMLMHTRAFGKYNGPEEVVLRTNNFTEINLIQNYADIARVDFRIIDENGQPVENARVEFKIYNYAEFYSAVTKYTDANGKTFLSAGKGDLMVWASKDGKYGYQKTSFGTDKQVTITISANHQTDYATHDVDVVPPVKNTKMPDVTEAQQSENKRRFAYEDSLRHAYMDSEFAVGDVRDDWKINLTKAKAHQSTILKFLEQHDSDTERNRAFGILNTLSDKDFTDVPYDVLEDAFLAETDQLDVRVEDEPLLYPYKQALAKLFNSKQTKAFRADPSKLVEWVRKNVRLNPDKRAMRIAQSPAVVAKYLVSDSRSRDIFFVSLARSLNIEARKDVVTSKVQYRKDAQWVDVDFETAQQTIAPQGKLVLRYSPTRTLDDPKYYSHFSISRIENGRAVLLNFEEGQVDMGGGTSWSNTFKNGASLDAGTYLLVTGQRMASGKVLATMQTFDVVEGQTTTLDLNLRTDNDDVSVIGSFDSESKFTKDGNEVSILSQTGRGYFVVGLLGIGQEPTNHALRDIAKEKQALDQWGRPFVLLFENEAELKKFHQENFGQLPKNTILGIDTDGRIKQQIVSQMKLPTDKLLPIFIIGDTFNRVVFSSQGYTIGLGEQLRKIAEKL